MYTVINFGIVGSSGLASQPLDIRVRENEVVMPLRIAYVISVVSPGGVRDIDLVVSRSRLHRTDPPTGTQMFNGGLVFFGHIRISQLREASALGLTAQALSLRFEMNLRGVVVAGDLTVCVDNGQNVALRIRCEFFYEIAPVSRAAKAMAIWRREVDPVPA